MTADICVHLKLQQSTFLWNSGTNRHVYTTGLLAAIELSMPVGKLQQPSRSQTYVRIGIGCVSSLLPPLQHAIQL